MEPNGPVFTFGIIPKLDRSRFASIVPSPSLKITRRCWRGSAMVITKFPLLLTDSSRSWKLFNSEIVPVIENLV